MTDRDAEFLAAYRAHRFDDQYGWYEERVEEYQRAHDQILTITGTALFAAAAAGLAASANLLGGRVAWAVLAAVLSGFATLARAYDQLLGYEQNSKVYRDALAALGRLRGVAPWIGHADPDPAEITTFVGRAESILQREISQWGQLAKEYPAAEPDVPGADLGDPR